MSHASAALAERREVSNGVHEQRPTPIGTTFWQLQVAPINEFVYRMAYQPADDVQTFPLQESCPACGSRERPELVVAVGGKTFEAALKVVACRRCLHVTYDRLPTQAWAEKFYRQTWDQYGRQKVVHEQIEPQAPSRWPHFLALNVPKDARILDFGCGFGKGLLGLQALGYQNLFGVEIGDHRAETAARYFPGRVRCGSVAEAAQLAREHGAFDLIISNHVFEHLHDPADTLSRLAELLKPSGVFVNIVPDVYGETPIITSLYLPHLHLFNRASMMCMMERARLKPFAWTPAAREHELVVVGARDRSWRPLASEHFSDEPTVAGAEELTRLAEFIRAPWQPLAPGGKWCLRYFQPPLLAKHPAGFLTLKKNAGLSLYAALQKKKVIKFLTDRPFLGYLVPAVFRRLDSNRAIGLENVLELQPVAKSEIPWLIARDGSMPVLVK
jgi:SAM-dependent methyltransferase